MQRSPRLSRPTSPRPSVRRAAAAQAVEALETRRLFHGDFTAQVNFQTAGAPVPTGFVADVGATYGAKANGLTYGWNADNTLNARFRATGPNVLRRTLNHMQWQGDYRWEIAVANGTYKVTVVAGDPEFTNSVYRVAAEGMVLVSGTPNSTTRFFEGTGIVNVTDGKLTISNATGAVNNKICYVTIQDTHDTIVNLQTITKTTAEGSATPGQLRVTRMGDLTNPLVVRLGLSGTASNGVDYKLLGTSVTIGAGKSFANIDVLALDDAAVEGSETATVTIAADDAYVRGTSLAGTVTILDNDTVDPTPAKPTVTITKLQDAAEGGAAGQFRVTRAGASTGDALVVNYTVGGTATNAVDYAELFGNVTIAAGQTSAVVNVNTVNDALVEGTESVSLTLSDNAAYTLGTAKSASLNITDNDLPAGTPSIQWSSFTGPEEVFSESQSAVVNGKLYIFSGYPNNFIPTKKCFVYDPGTNKWARIADIPEALTHAQPVVVGNEVWLPSGDPGVSNGQIFGTEKVFIYNTVTNTWRMGPSLPAKRAGGGAVLLDNKIHYFGGDDFNRQKDQVTHWALDLNNQAAGWKTLAPMPQARNHLSSVVYNGEIYALGGQTGYDGGSVPRSDVFIYNPTTNTWRTGPSMPGPRSHTVNATFVLNGKIFMLAGNSKQSVWSRTVFVFDGTSWSQSTQLPMLRSSSACGVIDGKIYVIGGYADGGIIQQQLVGILV
jgi:N-acetylneuraminic acid mutarotase